MSADGRINPGRPAVLQQPRSPLVTTQFVLFSTQTFLQLQAESWKGHF